MNPRAAKFFEPPRPRDERVQEGPPYIPGDEFGHFDRPLLGPPSPDGLDNPDDFGFPYDEDREPANAPMPGQADDTRARLMAGDDGGDIDLAAPAQRPSPEVMAIIKMLLGVGIK